MIVQNLKTANHENKPLPLSKKKEKKNHVNDFPKKDQSDILNLKNVINL